MPALLVEADDGLLERVLYGGVVGGPDAELGCSVSEERDLLRHHNVFVVPEAVVVDVARTGTTTRR